MTHLKRAGPVLVILALLAAAVGTGVEPVAAAPLACDPDQQQASGAWYRICMPPLFWNGDLFVYAHGYVSPTEPVGIPEDQMSLGGVSIDTIVNLMGYAFATTSYSTNGLAVRPAIDDLLDLVDIFSASKGTPGRVLLVGVSEGGLITALSVEQHPEVYDGGLALCGPYGDFRRQVNHLGDFRAVFDYFFPGLMPGDPTDIPEWLMEQWDSYYAANIQPEIIDPANAYNVAQLLAVTGAAYDPADPDTREETIERLLWYNVFATNDAADKLGGQPFDNLDRVYAGSDDDEQLNLDVQRVGAHPAALAEIEAHYQTSGQISVPVVTLHTTGDYLVPYWHALRYRGKTVHADNVALHEQRRSEAYGHCSFTLAEVMDAFNRLVQMVNDPPPYQPVRRAYLPAVQQSVLSSPRTCASR